MMRRVCPADFVVAISTLWCAPTPTRAADALERTYAALQPSLVLIGTYKGKKPIALGSGFVVGNRDGHALILTNRHVVAGGDR
jgi:S1-C subfamily serine protease